MANTLGVYNPIFYANEALINLEKALGIAGRVHMGFDEERRTFGRGDTINIRRPSTFTVNNAPSTAQDLETETVAMTLDQWKEVKFKLPDNEHAYTGDRIINEHIRPAAYALADNIDLALAALYKDIPWVLNSGASTLAVADVTGARRTLFDNAVPMTEGMLHGMVSGKGESELLSLEAFSQFQGAGARGVETQLRGNIGTRYGIEHFANQNTQTHTPGTASTGTLAVNGATAKDATTINLDAGTLTGTVVPGDSFVIAGNSQRYAVTNTVTASGNALTGVTFTPALAAAAADNAVVTLDTEGTKTEQYVYHHRNAFALAFARLPDFAQWENSLGAQVASVQDPVTGLAVRARIYYVGDSSEMHVALDVLYGVKTLDPNMAMRLRHNP